MTIILLASCSSYNRRKQAKQMADKLINDISLGKADNAFPEKYFSKEQTNLITVITCKIYCIKNNFNSVDFQ